MRGCIMSYCIGCGQFLAQGTRFCRFCGSQQPNEQVIAMLQMEAQQIQAMMFQQQQNMGQNVNQMPQGYMNQQQPTNYQNNGQQRQW